jgi:hypothetical protein
MWTSFFEYMSGGSAKHDLAAAILYDGGNGYTRNLIAFQLFLTSKLRVNAKTHAKSVSLLIASLKSTSH